MAYCDYQHCVVCDCTAFYDAEVDYKNAQVMQVASICKTCTDRGYSISVCKDGKEVEMDKLAGGVFIND